LRIRLLAKALLLIVLLCVGDALFSNAAFSQTVPPPVGVHRDTLDAFAVQPYPLRPFVMAETVRVMRNGTPISPEAIRLDAVEGRLWVRPVRRLERSDTLIAVYRTFPLDLRTVYRRRAIAGTDFGRDPSAAERAPSAAAMDSLAKDSLAKDSLAKDSLAKDAPVSDSLTNTSQDSRARAGPLPDADSLDGFVVVEEGARDSLQAFDPFAGVDLQRTGSITRGVAGGTNQDAGIESGLRLQLNGNLTDDVAVRAVLTDQNTPIQPDGTTQRLDDFDRVFIEIETPQATAQLGDVDVAFQDTEFARFARKIQGATLRSSAWGPAVGLSEGRATVLGAVSRGQYRTQDIQPIDGVQGPYRLSGLQGERFIVVVAGSETVYLDGQPLERGRTNDYVIDYARGELTFTGNRIITDAQRVTVEFQYRTSQFDRTLVGGRGTAGIWKTDTGRSRIRTQVTFLREADGRDFGSAFDLSTRDSLALVNAGDGAALRSGAERVEFDPEAPFVQYLREVRTTGGTTDTLFVALEEAPPEGTPVFRVTFSRVGPGEGDYDRVGRQQNGILYEFVGEGRGEYSPRQPIPRPEKRQLLDLTAQVEPVVGVQMYGEWARSVIDENRFSPLDTQDDAGRGYLAGVRLQPVPVEWGATALGTVSANIQRRRRGRTFEMFDQTRDIEFNRRWNLSRTGSAPSSELLSSGDEVADQAELAWAFTRRSRATVGAGRLAFGTPFDAERLSAALQLEETGAPRVSAAFERVESTNRLDATEGVWTRHLHTVRQPLSDVEPFVRFEREDRDQSQRSSGQASPGAFAFQEWTPGVRLSGDRLSGLASVAYRTEDETLEGTTLRAATATTANAEVVLSPVAPYDLSVQSGYRVRRFTAPFQDAGRRDTESILMQVDAGAQPWRRAVDARLFYDARTEREPTLQEVYVRTGPELGQFVWLDANDDGIQQVDEFVPETTPNEGAYVQSFVPSDSLASVVSVDTRLRVRLDPGRVWRRSTSRLKRWASRIETRSTIEVREKSRSGALTRLYLLDPSALRQEGTTVDGTLRLQQEVDLFPQGRTAGLDLGWTQSQGLTERAAGQERQFLNAWQAEGRLRPGTAWTVRLAGAVQRDRIASEAFSDARSFDIFAQQIRPELTYRPSQAWRVTGAATLAVKDDDAAGRRAEVIRVPLEVEWARAGTLRLTGKGEVSDIRLDGEAVGLAQFELTDGRGPGRSYLWGASGQYQVSDNIRATFAYDGRAPADAPTIHTFRINVTAQF
jgi:hypothetical protein